ncbi:MAG: STAS-like domain-containing protein [Methanothrix sp.]|nr:STAS-like domain-containing protein [Methanothrix sp.]
MSVANVEEAKVTVDERQFSDLHLHSIDIEEMSMMDMAALGVGPVELICVPKIAKSGFCLSSSCGHELYEVIADALHSGKGVLVSFGHVSDISSAFLESSIGRLYRGNFSDEEIAKKVVVCGLSDDDAFVLKMIIDRTKDYSKNPDHFEAEIKEVLGEADE